MVMIYFLCQANSVCAAFWRTTIRQNAATHTMARPIFALRFGPNTYDGHTNICAAFLQIVVLQNAAPPAQIAQTYTMARPLRFGGRPSAKTQQLQC